MIDQPGARGALPMSRRGFVAALGAAAGAAAAARSLAAQQPPVQGAANAPMEQGAYRPVTVPAIAGAAPAMTAAERDDLEHRLRCQCGCTLDVYTCRTTDFSCGVSPAMHGDVMALVEGGHSAAEIIAAFRTVYGEQVLMAPPREGFNWLGYLVPFGALGAGLIAVIAVLRRMRERPVAPRVASVGGPPLVAGTPDELARIAAAVRDDAQ